MVCLKRPKINYKKANNQYIMLVGFWYASRYDLLFSQYMLLRMLQDVEACGFEYYSPGDLPDGK